MPITSLAVFCGSQPGSDPLYCQHAKALGYMLAQKNITLIYGGSNKGIMGAVANAVLEKNGRVIGVMPKLMISKEHRHNLSEWHETQDMHSRKKMMYASADAALILPGGYGTMDELFEMLTWNQLNIQNKKVIIFNITGFFDHLIAHFKKMENSGFLYKKFSTQLTLVTSLEELRLIL